MHDCKPLFFLPAALIAAIFYVGPNDCPFFAPGKRAVAGNAYFCGEIFFLNIFQNYFL
jgi:hypothetical protein